MLGDPINAELTEAIIELGWNPPSPDCRTQWDLLPLVTMGENDEPAIFELPDQLKQLVHIRHPRYQKEFEQLDLRWVGFPALSRLGFDIGGVQYTATPFAGWFMDAEIGVRDLADTFRYNVLPKVAQALKLYDLPDRELDELPEYVRLAALVCNFPSLLPTDHNPTLFKPDSASSPELKQNSIMQYTGHICRPRYP